MEVLVPPAPVANMNLCCTGRYRVRCSHTGVPTVTQVCPKATVLMFSHNQQKPTTCTCRLHMVVALKASSLLHAWSEVGSLAIHMYIRSNSEACSATVASFKCKQMLSTAPRRSTHLNGCQLSAMMFNFFIKHLRQSSQSKAWMDGWMYISTIQFDPVWSSLIQFDPVWSNCTELLLL